MPAHISGADLDRRQILRDTGERGRRGDHVFAVAAIMADSGHQRFGFAREGLAPPAGITR